MSKFVCFFCQRIMSCQSHFVCGAYMSGASFKSVYLQRADSVL